MNVFFSPLDSQIASLDFILTLLLIGAALALICYGTYRLAHWVRKARAEPWPTPPPPPPLDATGWTLVIDGSNVARHRDSPDLNRLLSFLDNLHERLPGAEHVVFCDANLRHKFSREHREAYVALLGQREPCFEECPGGTTADEVLLKYARDGWPCIVVSNDKFANRDEVRLRQGIPLLKFSVKKDNTAHASQNVVVYKGADEMSRPTTIPLGRLLESPLGQGHR
ncbi:MAG: NYN domain-containing protein [Bradymonadaceae bacterium]